MKKYLIRIIALVLIPCMITDPVSASALASPLSPGRGPAELGVRGDIATQSRFKEEAFANRYLLGNRLFSNHDNPRSQTFRVMSRHNTGASHLSVVRRILGVTLFGAGAVAFPWTLWYVGLGLESTVSFQMLMVGVLLLSYPKSPTAPMPEAKVVSILTGKGWRARSITRTIIGSTLSLLLSAVLFSQSNPASNQAPSTPTHDVFDWGGEYAVHGNNSFLVKKHSVPDLYSLSQAEFPETAYFETVMELDDITSRVEEIRMAVDKAQKADKTANGEIFGMLAVGDPDGNFFRKNIVESVESGRPIVIDVNKLRNSAPHFHIALSNGGYVRLTFTNNPKLIHSPIRRVHFGKVELVYGKKGPTGQPAPSKKKIPDSSTNQLGQSFFSWRSVLGTIGTLPIFSALAGALTSSQIGLGPPPTSWLFPMIVISMLVGSAIAVRVALYKRTKGMNNYAKQPTRVKVVSPLTIALAVAALVLAPVLGYLSGKHPTTAQQERQRVVERAHGTYSTVQHIEGDPDWHVILGDGVTIGPGTARVLIHLEGPERASINCGLHIAGEPGGSVGVDVNYEIQAGNYVPPIPIKAFGIVPQNMVFDEFTISTSDPRVKVTGVTFVNQPHVNASPRSSQFLKNTATILSVAVFSLLGLAFASLFTMADEVTRHATPMAGALPGPAHGPSLGTIVLSPIAAGVLLGGGAWRLIRTIMRKGSAAQPPGEASLVKSPPVKSELQTGLDLILSDRDVQKWSVDHKEVYSSRYTFVDITLKSSPNIDAAAIEFRLIKRHPKLSKKKRVPFEITYRLAGGGKNVMMAADKDGFLKDIQDALERVRPSLQNPAAPPTAFFRGGEKVDWTKWAEEPTTGQIYDIHNPSIRATKNSDGSYNDPFGGGLPKNAAGHLIDPINEIIDVPVVYASHPHQFDWRARNNELEPDKILWLEMLMFDDGNLVVRPRFYDNGRKAHQAVVISLTGENQSISTKIRLYRVTDPRDQSFGMKSLGKMADIEQRLGLKWKLTAELVLAALLSQTNRLSPYEKQQRTYWELCEERFYNWNNQETRNNIEFVGLGNDKPTTPIQILNLIQSALDDVSVAAGYKVKLLRKSRIRITKLRQKKGERKESSGASESDSPYIDGTTRILHPEWQMLPVDGTEGQESEWEAIGVKLGDKAKGDDLFRFAEIPKGWKIVPTNHALWSDLVDAESKVRARIFYKYAFYDRQARIFLNKGSSQKDDLTLPADGMSEKNKPKLPGAEGITKILLPSAIAGLGLLAGLPAGQASALNGSAHGPSLGTFVLSLIAAGVLLGGGARWLIRTIMRKGSAAPPITQASPGPVDGMRILNKKYHYPGRVPYIQSRSMPQPPEVPPLPANLQKAVNQLPKGLQDASSSVLRTLLPYGPKLEPTDDADWIKFVFSDPRAQGIAVAMGYLDVTSRKYFFQIALPSILSKSFSTPHVDEIQLKADEFLTEFQTAIALINPAAPPAATDPVASAWSFLAMGVAQLKDWEVENPNSEVRDLIEKFRLNFGQLHDQVIFEHEPLVVYIASALIRLNEIELARNFLSQHPFKDPRLAESFDREYAGGLASEARKAGDYKRAIAIYSLLVKYGSPENRKVRERNIENILVEVVPQILQTARVLILLVQNEREKYDPRGHYSSLTSEVKRAITAAEAKEWEAAEGAVSRQIDAIKLFESTDTAYVRDATSRLEEALRLIHQIRKPGDPPGPSKKSEVAYLWRGEVPSTFQHSLEARVSVLEQTLSGLRLRIHKVLPNVLRVPPDQGGSQGKPVENTSTDHDPAAPSATNELIGKKAICLTFYLTDMLVKIQIAVWGDKAKKLRKMTLNGFIDKELYGPGDQQIVKMRGEIGLTAADFRNLLTGSREGSESRVDHFVDILIASHSLLSKMVVRYTWPRGAERYQSDEAILEEMIRQHADDAAILEEMTGQHIDDAAWVLRTTELFSRITEILGIIPPSPAASTDRHKAQERGSRAAA